MFLLSTLSSCAKIVSHSSEWRAFGSASCRTPREDVMSIDPGRHEHRCRCAEECLLALLGTPHLQ